MTKQLTRAAEELDTTSEDLKTINMLTNNERALQRVLQIVEKTNPTDEDINFIGTYLFIALTYKSLQRAGAACNLTVDKANKRQFIKDEEEG